MFLDGYSRDSWKRKFGMKKTDGEDHCVVFVVCYHQGNYFQATTILTDHTMRYIILERRSSPVKDPQRTCTRFDSSNLDHIWKVMMSPFTCPPRPSHHHGPHHRHYRCTARWATCPCNQLHSTALTPPRPPLAGFLPSGLIWFGSSLSEFRLKCRILMRK